MHVLILAPEPPSRGVLQSVTSHGIIPIVVRPREPAGPDGMVIHERVAARGDPHDPLSFRWSRRALRTVLRDKRPELLHLIGDPWTPTAETGAAAARDLKIPSVLVGTSALGGAKGITARWQANRVRDGAAALAGISKPALDHLCEGAGPVPRAVLPQPGFAIPSAIAVREPPPFPTFAIVGRLVPERGIDLALRALAEVFGEWRLLIVGTGPSQEELERQAQTLGLSARIEWLGGLPRQELEQLWPRIDVLVAPSRSTPAWVEPTGTVVLEAMSHGVAVVVSRSGALPDLVADSGMVVEEDDQPALARALARFVTEPALTRELGTSARSRALAGFSDGAIAERMVQLWRQVRREK